MTTAVFVRVALDHPLPTLFDYRWNMSTAAVPGTLVSRAVRQAGRGGARVRSDRPQRGPRRPLRAVNGVCTAYPPLSARMAPACCLCRRLLPARSWRGGAAGVAARRCDDASRWSRLLAPEERYSLTPQGRPHCPTRCRRAPRRYEVLAQALAANDFLLPPTPARCTQSHRDARRMAGRRLGCT